jgi:hypothetical protein
MGEDPAAARRERHLMDGMEGAVALIVDRMTPALATKTAELRERYDVNPDTEGHLLPDFHTVAAYNRARLGVEEWPALLVSGLNTETMRRSDQPGIWLCQYRLRGFIWVRGEDGTGVQLAQHRLTLAVRELLMERRTLTEDAMVDDASLRESYSELARDDNQETVAGAYVEFLLWVSETLADADKPPLGQVEETQIDTAHLPPHPAL